MPLTFTATSLTPKVQDLIFQGFQEYSLYILGEAGDHLDESPRSFEAWDQETFVGAVVVKRFWGQMHIKYLYVHKDYRQHRIASYLMEQAFAYARGLRCAFIFVETLSFQAVGFYQKLGFKIEFTRPGYSQGVSFHYLKKDL